MSTMPGACPVNFAIIGGEVTMSNPSMDINNSTRTERRCNMSTHYDRAPLFNQKKNVKKLAILFFYVVENDYIYYVIKS